MKKLLPLLVLPFILTGCINYGTGEETGTIYAVDDGIIHGQVWIKSGSNAGGNGDEYCIDDKSLMTQLRAIPDSQQVKITYDRHLWLWVPCGGNKDIVTGFTIIK